VANNRCDARLASFLILGLSLFTAVRPVSALAQWTPEQPVEIISANSPGGGVDRIARSLQRILHERKLVPRSIVVNKPGGAGAVAWTYLDRQEGNGHYLAVATPTIMTNHITGRSTYNHTNFTALAHLFTESVAFAVRFDSPIKNWADLMARMKKDPASVTLASSSREGAAPLTFAMAAKQAGINPRQTKLVVFNSTGEAVTALLGGHVTVTLTIAGAVSGHLSENKVRILATSASKRASYGPFAVVPTLMDQGVSVSFRSWRGILGPRNMPAAQVAYWDNAFARMVATEEWEKELATYDGANEYQNSTKARAYFETQYDQLKLILSDLGLAKN